MCGSGRFLFAAVPAIAMSLAAFPAPAAAQIADADDSMDDVRSIIVTGRGLDDAPSTPAYDVTKIDRDRLLASASGRIDDVLMSVAGFQQFRRSDSRSSNPSAQGVTLRALGGNATSRALLLLDGVPMADPFFGYIPLSAIAPERLVEARVTRGGGSGPFGIGGLAGTIELTSADAATLGLASGRLLVNDRGETEASATIAPQLGQGFAVVSGRWDRGQGFYTTPTAQRGSATARAAYDSWSVQLRGVAPLTDTIELQVRGLAYDDQRTLRFDGADSGSSGQDASVRFVGRGDWQFDLIAFVQARDFSNIVISSTRFTPTLDQRATPSTGLGGKFELRPPVGGNHLLRIGVDYRHADGELFENALNTVTGAITARRNAGGTNSDFGLFVEDDWTLGALTLTGGVRADRYRISGGFFTERNAAGTMMIDRRYADRSGWGTTLRGGALFRPSPTVALRAAAYSGLRLPTLNELYRPFVVFPVTTQANADLRNEKLEGFEAGIDLTPGAGVHVSLTAFDNKVKRAIANVTIAPNLRQRRNIDAIEAQGVELSAGINRSFFDFDASLAYTDAKARGSGPAAALSGKRPAQTPRWAASGTLTVRPAEGWRLSATLRHVGRQYEDDLQTDILPAATTVDAYAEVALTKGLAIVLRGENLTDEKVITRNQGGSIDLGAPRTVWAGVRVGL